MSVCAIFKNQTYWQFFINLSSKLKVKKQLLLSLAFLFFVMSYSYAEISDTEPDSLNSEPETNIFKSSVKNSASTGELNLKLYESSAYFGNQEPADGVFIFFDDIGNNGIDPNDAIDFTNLDENFAINNNGTLLSVEARATPTALDEIQLEINTYRSINYVIEVIATALQGDTPFLVDTYLNQLTQILPNGIVTYAYSIDSGIAESFAGNRFKIIFKNTSCEDINETYTGCSGDGYVYTSPSGTVYNESNPTGTETITDANGCDYTVTVALIFNTLTADINETYTGCSGDGYVYTSPSGTVYNESNPTGTETITDANGCDYTVTVALIFNTLTADINETYTGCSGDGYVYTSPSGTVYNESNPTGTETITDANGCDYTVTVALIFNTLTADINETYTGCSGDGHTYTSLSGTVYNESNPTGTETITDANGCDYTVTVAFTFNALPIVIAMTSDLVVCIGESVTLTGGGASTYSWNNGVTDGVSFVPTETTIYTVTGTDTNGCINTALVTVTVDSNTSIDVSLKAFLEGPYNPNTGLMFDYLRVNGLISISSPYLDGITTDASTFDITGENAIVDWVWIEIRDSNRVDVIGATSALIQVDGDIVDVDGVSPLSFDIPQGDYHIMISHRNHLGVITVNTLSFTYCFNVDLDLTENIDLILGGLNGGKILENASVVMYSGDSDGNSQIQNTDKIVTKLLIGASGLFDEDLDLNGQVQNSDVQNKLIPNLGKGFQNSASSSGKSSESTKSKIVDLKLYAKRNKK